MLVFKTKDFISGLTYVAQDYSKAGCHPGFHIPSDSAARTE
jgi:hypothetical protein